MIATSIMVVLSASLLGEAVAEPPVPSSEPSEASEPSSSPTKPEASVAPTASEPAPTITPGEAGEATEDATSSEPPPAESTEPPLPVGPEPAAPSCRREDFESFDDYVDCRSQATGVAPPGPFAESTPPLVRPTTLDPAYLPELQRADDLQKAGGTVLAVGLGSLAAAGLLNMAHNWTLEPVWTGTSPGPTGFPAARWSDLAKHVHRSDRLYVASLVTLSMGAALLIGGTTTLIVGTNRKRWVRAHTIEITPGGLTLRW